MSQEQHSLIAHAGLERAVLGREAHDFGNPLRLRRALDAGVRVVIAHCASMGEDQDSTAARTALMSTAFRSSFGFSRDTRPAYGDISAMTQVNRAGPALARVIEEQGWHARLLNGSDYPLPGVMPIFSVDYLVSLGMIEARRRRAARDPAAQPAALRFRAQAQLARMGGKCAAARVFETRAFFVR